MTVKRYAAPLEGISGFVWRKAHREIFGGADKYFTYFLTPNQNYRFETKELREITQDEEDLVPQILTGKAEHFNWAADELSAMGYGEINLNLGCPSGTVVAKGKGSGMFRDLEYLDRFLDEIYDHAGDMRISIKTRTGLESEEEWPQILEIFERYPVHELIIHPRIRTQFYNGKANRELFRKTMEHTKLPLVYNGDIADPEDEAFSYGCPVMAGRGLIQNPAMFRQADKGKAASREELKELHDRLLEGYRGYMSGDGPVIHHMREYWTYSRNLFEMEEREYRKLMKAKKLSEYTLLAGKILKNCPLKDD